MTSATPVWGPSDPPLDQPHYGIAFLPAFRRMFRKYATFSGRASRSEYWWAYLGVVIITLLLQMLYFIVSIIATTQVSVSAASGRTGSNAGEMMLAFAATIPIILFALAIFIPQLALMVRRLHDAGYSGWWVLLSFVPFGGIVVLVFLIMDSRPEGIRFDDGPNAGTVLHPSAYASYGQYPQEYGQLQYGQQYPQYPQYPQYGQQDQQYGQNQQQYPPPQQWQ